MKKQSSFSKPESVTTEPDGRVNVVWDPAVCAFNEVAVANGSAVPTNPVTAQDSQGVDPNRPPVGMRDEFKGPYRKGIDRRPGSVEEHAILASRGWLGDLEDTTTGTDERVTDAQMFSRTVAFVLGGVTEIGNDGTAPSTRKTRITGCLPGLTAYHLGKFPAGAKVAVELGSVRDVGNVTGTFAISTEIGPRVGPSVIREMTSNTASMSFPIDERLVGKDVYLNADYKSANPDEFIQVSIY